MKPVAQLLKKAKLGHLAPASSDRNEVLADGGLDQTGTMLGNPGDVKQSSPSIPSEMAETMAAEAILNSGVSGVSPLSGAQDFSGAEIICIVRTKGPGASSRVVIINQASSRFVDDLLHESTGTERGLANSFAPYRQSNKSIESKRANESRPQSFAQSTPQKTARTGAIGKSNRRPIETSYEADGNSMARE